MLVSHRAIFVLSSKALACRGKKWLHETVVDIIILLMYILLKQDKLGQDVFLIGSPGPSRRLLAMQYLVNLKISTFFNIVFYHNVSPRKHMLSDWSNKFTCH